MVDEFDSLPEDTEEINVSDKGLTVLDVTRFKKLKMLYCHNNRLTSLHLNEKLQIIFYNDNLIYEIIRDIEYNNINKIKQKAKLLNNFRCLYYCLHFCTFKTHIF